MTNNEDRVPKRPIHFRNRYIVRHFGVRHTDHTLDIVLGDSFNTTLQLRPIEDPEVKEFYATDDWVAVVVTEEEVSERVAEQFQLLPETRRPAVDQIVTRVGSRVNDFVKRVLYWARWRTGVYGHHQAIRCTEQGNGFQWSLDAIDWKSAENIRVELSDELAAVPFDTSVWKELQSLVQSDSREPVAHELLREAWNLQAHSPRSSLMLGLAALEVGIKECISELLGPNTKWLCFELPSPPLFRILDEYLPKLPVRATIDGKVFIPLNLMKKIKALVTQRNQVTHKGVQVESTLSDSLTVVQTTLYLLDFYCGHCWAINNIRDAEVSALIQTELEKSKTECARSANEGAPP